MLQCADLFPLENDANDWFHHAGRFASIGQNQAEGYTSWTRTIIAWHGESGNFTYGQEPGPGVVVGHYTQVGLV